jgi:cell division initiation protein
MKMTPLDIRKQEFKKVMRGYDPVEVDTFLETLATEMEEQLRQQKELRDRTLELDTQLKDYKQVERTLQQTLLQAQEVTGKTYESARREGEAIVRESESRAATIMENANREVARLGNELSQLKIRRESLIGRLRILLSSELDLLRTMDQGLEDVLTPPPSLGSGKQQLDVESVVNAISHDRPAQTR